MFMTDTQDTTLLDRHWAILEAAKQSTKLRLLEDLASCGASLIPRAYENGDRSVTNGVILFHLLREVVIQVDALHILLSNGCGPATPSVSRSLIEKYHLLLWTLKSNSDDKAEYLLVGSARNFLKQMKIAIPGTAENEEMTKLMGKSPDDPDLIRGSVHNADWCQRFLSMPRFAEISQMFDTHRAGSKKKPREEKWPVVYCKSTNDTSCNGSAKSISENLQKSEDYIVYFSGYSESTHGSAAFESLTIGDRRLHVNNIRGLEEFDSAWHLAIYSAIDSFRAVVSHFCPDDLLAFENNWAAKWLNRIEE
jgi:hypothetical protein